MSSSHSASFFICTKTMSPHVTEETLVSSSSSCCLHPGAQRRRRRRRRGGGGGGGGGVEVKHHPVMKRRHREQLISEKCVELQSYVRPLASILRSLRTGRFSERLSSFQEHVAMDRIQRIMGVLQNPDVSDHVLSIVLKIAEMLQSWFPHVRLNDGRDETRKHHHVSSSFPPSASSSSLMCLQTLTVKPGRPSSRLEATQDDTVSSSTDSPPRRTITNARLHRAPPPPPPLNIRSPCLQRLLLAKESMVTGGGGGVAS